MNKECKKLQDSLAAEGLGILQQDERARKHVEECEECFLFLEATRELTSAFENLPKLDVPDEVVGELLARPELQQPSAPVDKKKRLRLYAQILALSGTVAAMVFLSIPTLMRSNSAVEQTRGSASYLEDSPRLESRTRPLDADAPEKNEPHSTFESMDYVRQEAFVDEVESEEDEQLKRAGEGGGFASDNKRANLAKSIVPAAEEERERGFEDFDFRQPEGVEGGVPGGVVGGIVGGLPDAPASPERDVLRVGGKGRRQPKKIKDVRPVYPEEAKTGRVQGDVVLELLVDEKGNVAQARVLRSIPLLDQAALDAVKQWKYEPVLTDGKAVHFSVTVTVSFSLDEDQGAAGALLGERSSLAGLRFKQARGYWANTYVPGDATERLVRARLLQRDPSALQAYRGEPLRLHEASRQTAQPFDAPENAALAVYLSSDRGAVNGRTRALLQVGIQATPAHGGRRPAMNLALILDVRGRVPDEVAAGMRALVGAFQQAKELGDRFCLIVAGRPGGIVVEPREFRHGPLTVAMSQLFAEAGEATQNALTITEALKTAVEAVSASDDPNAAMGTSAVLLITGQPLGESEKTRLSRLAHQSAVGGVPVSVVGIGSGIDLDELDGVVLAGQGNRRLLERPSEAANLVDREVTAVGRVVARALRLRIRLAPGVELVDVLGSHRLDEAGAQRVRDAEQSLDLRMARHLGIGSDRGEDEEGIQIVIPNFYAGNHHVFLLDVVVPGPGPVADVRVRYKDLAYVRNGTARAGLSLGRGEKETTGPLERNVLKNFLAWRLSEKLEQAGLTLARANSAEAARLLGDFQNLLQGLRRSAPGLKNDPNISSDIAMLGEYLALLETEAPNRPDARGFLSDSLRYASRLRILPRLAT